METKIKKIMTALQKMPENDLTRNVLIPLLEHLGFINVEYFGGTNEEGKDIVFWEKNKFGELNVNVAQVKHFKITNTASDIKSLQTIINQLIMCFEKKLVFTNQKSYLPSEVLLISSYPITVKTLQTRFSDYSDLRGRKIEIIDGNKLASLLIEHNLEIVKKILGQEYDFTSYFETTLNNKTVLKALQFNDNISLKEIYSDIDFSLGKSTTKIFFNTKFFGKKNLCKLNKKNWDELKKVIVETENQIGIKYINLPIKKIEENYEIDFEKYKLWNLEITNNKKKIVDQKEEKIKLLNNFKSFEKERSLLITEQHKINENGENFESSKKINKSRLNKITKLLIIIAEKEEPIINITNKIESIQKQLANLEKNEPNLTYNVEIDGEILATILNEKKEIIEEKVKLFNKQKPNCNELKGFVDDCKNIIDSSTKILQNTFILDNVLLIDKNIVLRENFEKTRFKLPIDEIFNTGHNVILLGEAGAGKTTCLQMYALSKKNDDSKLIIWAPLSHIIQNWSKNNIKSKNDFEKDDEMKINHFDSAIFEYLKSKNISFTIDEFEKIFESKESIFLLDGLDEAIKQNSWLPKAIINLTEKYKKTQIIVTSRMSGDHVDLIPFFTVTLLPFTHKQRDEFIKKWFGPDNSNIIKEITKHLTANKSINEVTRNPLLTTTLCVLAKHGLPLPQTEIKLYNDRIKLLTGYYDNVKNIDVRITTAPQSLELLAQKLAFTIHLKGVREMHFDKLLQMTIESMKDYFNDTAAKIALNELIDPCNILIPMTSDGKYGFGHLRYQEHLAAVEMKTNRSIDIEKYLTNQWWLDTLILFAQMSENLEWLVNKVSYQIEIKEIGDTMNKMIMARPLSEQKELKKKIAILKKEKNNFFNIFEEEEIEY